MNVLLRPVRTSVGSKYLMALTGLALIGFVVVHMSGNLLIFAGSDALNSYAKALKDQGPLLWVARGGLLLVFLLHVVLGIRLALSNRRARGGRYVYEDTVQASWASRHMLLTGLAILAFLLYNLAHFTFGVVTTATVVEDGKVEQKNYLDLHEAQDPTKGGPRHDVYAMVVSGFRNPWITLSYLVAQVFLWLHLWHGGSSFFQSLGVNHPAYNPLLRGVGPVLSTIVLIGNCSIPLAVLSGLIGGTVK
jgi:succinate dehydrogenase / fumarate reductase cytochrome b subunit